MGKVIEVFLLNGKALNNEQFLNLENKPDISKYSDKHIELVHHIEDTLPANETRQIILNLDTSEITISIPVS